ncbi:MAG: FAD-binding oxidoreductase [Rhizobiales bacterium]|nr:FAD-binding oxidoreductase [Hyphomicrobiales bacterium]
MSKHVIVIGSGIIGSSIAYQLARRGARVTILDEGEPGGVATRASFAWINASWGNPDFYFRLRRRSMAEWRGLAAEIPDLQVSWCGGLLWDVTGDARDDFLRDHAHWGYGLRVVDRTEIEALEPGLAAPPAEAIHVAEEGVVEPLDAALALLTAARGLGAELFTPVRVKWLDVEAGKVRGVLLDDGHIQADEVVVAAGAGAPALLASADFDLPLELPPGLLVHSEPAPPLIRGLVMAPELHLRQTREGVLVAGSDFGGSDPGAEPRKTAEELFRKVQGFVKGGKDLVFGGFSVGYRPTPRDGLPVIGKVPSAERLYAAVMHSGITNAAAVGLFAAHEILGGEREVLLERFRPERFCIN